MTLEECLTCGGVGEVTVLKPHEHHLDPMAGSVHTCPLCGGKGEVEPDLNRSIDVNRDAYSW